jgi:hypothetical protein
LEPVPFQFFSRYFWVIAIGFSLINYVIGRRRIVAESSLNEIRRSDTLGLFGRLCLYSNVPWLVMGWGILAGGVPSVFSYFRPQDHNAYVTGWYACMLLLAIANAFWIVLADGAARVRELQQLGVFGSRQKNSTMSAWSIKLLALLGPVFVLIWIYWMQFITTLPPR